MNWNSGTLRRACSYSSGQRIIEKVIDASIGYKLRSRAIRGERSVFVFGDAIGQAHHAPNPSLAANALNPAITADIEAAANGGLRVVPGMIRRHRPD